MTKLHVERGTVLARISEAIESLAGIEHLLAATDLTRDQRAALVRLRRELQTVFDEISDDASLRPTQDDV